MSDISENSGFVPPSIEELNQELPSYEVIELIACGGMGAVYRARQISLDRMVAIKILPPELAVDETFRQSFEAEGKAMAKVSHSNLVGVYDFGKVSNMLYLVIEFVEGSNLYESMGESAVDAEVSVNLIGAVATGLAEAHRNALVHRDIKPANILINIDLVPKLGDFGLAVPDSDIESGLMMGTPAYLAPEVLENPASASFASDTYALGVILYEMVTGSSIERGDVMDLSLVPAMGDLPKIVRKAVDPKPLLRYQTGECFETALQDWLRKPKSVGLTAGPVRPVIRPRVTPVVSSGSGGGGGGVLIGLFLLIVVGGLAWMMLGGSSDSEGSVADVITEPTSLPADDPRATAAKSAADREKVLQDLRVTQRRAIEALSGKVADQRSQSRDEFRKVSGVEGEGFLKSGVKDQEGIPRYFFPGEVKVSDGLLVHLEKFGNDQQAELDREFGREMTSLYRESRRDLKAAEVELPKELKTSWETWCEWLGLNPLEMMHSSLAGRWKLSPSSEGFELQVSSSGRVRVVLDGEEFEETVSLEMNERGELTLRYSGDSALGFPWKLRWQGDRLQGEDANGGSRRLRLGYFDYEDLLDKEGDLDAPSVEAPETMPEDEVAKVRLFQDPEVATLTENYEKALIMKIEPLESGYLRVLAGFKERYEKRLTEDGLKQIKKEIARVEDLNWRGGRIMLEMLPKVGELPDDVARKQSVFQSEFERRFEPIQRMYRQALEKMLRQRKGRGRTDLEDIGKALKRLAVPEGVVNARYVKLVSLADRGLSHTTVATIEVLDVRGENLPYGQFSDIKVNTFSVSGDGVESSGREALDGDPSTFWHSKWGEDKDDFPHWISFDLGQEQLISGFSITPRSYERNRSTGITNWVFYVSVDGETWTTVAEGNFPKGDGLKKHLGFESSQ